MSNIESNNAAIIARMVAQHVIGAAAGRQWLQDCAEAHGLLDDAVAAVRVLAVPADAAQARHSLAQAILGAEATEEEADELAGLLFPVVPTVGMVRGFVSGAR